jgi:hypothetical protein
MTLEINLYEQCHVKDVCWEQTEQMGTWGKCLQICFIVNYACFEEGSFLMWRCIKVAICTFIQTGEFGWFFILTSQVGKTS